MLISMIDGNANAYLVIYATSNGSTGHCGIAVDNYTIYVREKNVDGRSAFYYDTVHTGTLTYFDLWPKRDVYKGSYELDTDPVYYRLPSSSHKQLVSLKTLQDQGLPHKFQYPCDGILSITSSKKTDLLLLQYIEKLVDENAPFNSVKYNCCDFAIEALTFVTGKTISAKEFVLKVYVTTPNLLFREVSAWPGVQKLMLLL